MLRTPFTRRSFREVRLQIIELVTRKLDGYPYSKKAWAKLSRESERAYRKMLAERTIQPQISE